MDDGRHVETSTSWEDSGFDCDHCGGEIAKRTDHETGLPDQICYQCKLCGCQWAPEGDVLRVGNGPNCRAAQRERAGTKPGDFLLSPRVLMVLGVLLILALLRFGGLGTLVAVTRLLIPLGIVVVIVLFVVRFGREQEWW